jgi:hypothetical protein
MRWLSGVEVELTRIRENFESKFRLDELEFKSFRIAGSGSDFA